MVRPHELRRPVSDEVDVERHALADRPRTEFLEDPALVRERGGLVELEDRCVGGKRKPERPRVHAGTQQHDLPDALSIAAAIAPSPKHVRRSTGSKSWPIGPRIRPSSSTADAASARAQRDRKSTRLNSSH